MHTLLYIPSCVFLYSMFCHLMNDLSQSLHTPQGPYFNLRILRCHPYQRDHYKKPKRYMHTLLYIPSCVFLYSMFCHLMNDLSQSLHTPQGPYFNLRKVIHHVTCQHLQRCRKCEVNDERTTTTNVIGLVKLT